MGESLGFETKQEEKDRLSQRFDVLKSLVWKSEIIPEEFDADYIDFRYYEILTELFGNYRKKHCSKELSEKKCGLCKNKYIADKRIYELRDSENKTMLERRLRCSQTMNLLITSQKLTDKKTLILLFELLGDLTGNTISCAKMFIDAGLTIYCGLKKSKAKEKLTVMKDIKRSFDSEELSKFPVFLQAENILLHEKENEDSRSDD